MWGTCLHTKTHETYELYLKGSSVIFDVILCIRIFLERLKPHFKNGENMKTKGSFILVLMVLMVQPVYAKDPCESVLCLAGMLQGAGKVSSCSGAISDYFNIRKFKKGKFKPGRTSSARGSFLSGCPSGGAWPSKINSAYGTLWSK